MKAYQLLCFLSLCISHSFVAAAEQIPPWLTHPGTLTSQFGDSDEKGALNRINAD